MRGTPPDSRVYFIEDEATELIKIGFSIDVRNRIRALATTLGRPLILRADVFGGRPLERRLHAAFHSARQRGEWFTATDELRALIEIANTLGNDGPEISLNPRVPIELRRRFGLIARAASALDLPTTTKNGHVAASVAVSSPGTVTKPKRPDFRRIPKTQRALFSPEQAAWIEARAERLGRISFMAVVRMLVASAMEAESRRAAS